MSAVETQEVRAEVAADQSAESKAAENEEREPKSSPTRKRRAPPYARSFRDFLEQLGEDPGAFDTFRHGYWGAVHPEDAFEDDLFEDLVENRWELRRLKRTRQAKLVEIRRGKELKRQRGLASEGRGESGMAEKWLMNQEGFTGLPDSQYKFERTLMFLRGLRATVELEGFSEWGTGCLRVIFGEHPGLSASELVLDYKAGIKTQAEGNEEAQQAARQAFVTALGEEIKAYQKLEALYREGAIAIPEATRDAQLLLDEKDLSNLLRQERMLELEYQLKLEQLSAWRRGKATGVTDFNLAPGGALGQLAAGGGSVGRRPGRPPSLAGLKP